MLVDHFRAIYVQNRCPNPWFPEFGRRYGIALHVIAVMPAELLRPWNRPCVRGFGGWVSEEARIRESDG